MFNPLAFAGALNWTTPRKNNINPYLTAFGVSVVFVALTKFLKRQEIRHNRMADHQTGCGCTTHRSDTAGQI